MKLFLFLALAIFCSANAEEKIDPEHDYVYIPDVKGNLHLVDLLEKGEDVTGYTTGSTVPSRNVESITFNLYTNANPTTSQLLTLNNILSISRSNFLASRPTRFITHGWTSSKDGDDCTMIRDAYLAQGDYNIIVIDWSSIAALSYVNAVSSLTGVAARVASMINFMENWANLNLSDTIVIGMSLGAHVAGISSGLANGNIQAVVGLDPAGPLFANLGAGRRLHQTDADWVQVIHTNGEGLGIGTAIGDIDFYANGGKSQPGCGLDLAGICAHIRAYMYFAESIQNPTGFRANSYSDVFMGGPVFTTHVRGIFHFNTARSSPFALG